MSMANKPAFPFFIQRQDVIQYAYGINIRTYFAAMAMQGFLAANFENEKQTAISNDDIARLSVEMANSLLAELEKEGV